MNKDCHPVEQQTRQELLDWLYEQDGRVDKSHPMYGLYTGLTAAADEESSNG